MTLRTQGGPAAVSTPGAAGQRGSYLPREVGCFGGGGGGGSSAFAASPVVCAAQGGIGGARRHRPP
eukprot:8403478-Lingulodinium_polyedra.AAC.1